MTIFHSPVDAALRYAAHGWHVFPCMTGVNPTTGKPNKNPYTKNGHKDATTKTSVIHEWWRKWPDAQVGIACGESNLVVVDLDYDRDEGLDGPSFFGTMEDDHGNSYCELVATTPRGGRHMVYRMPAKARVRNRQDAIPGSGIDVRGDGGYILAPSPSPWSAGREWTTGDPFEADLTEPPEWIFDLLLRGASDLAERERIEVKAAPVVLPDSTVQDIRSALEHVDPDPRETWIRIGMALKSTGAAEQAYELWCDWSKTSDKFDPVVQRRQWRSLREFFWSGSEVSISTLFWLAREGGYTGGEPLPPAIPVELPDEPLVRPEVPRFRREWCNVPGVLGDVAAWITQHSPRQQPALSLASSLVTVGALLGRRVRSESDIRTNIYCLGIGNTGCGKDAGIRLPAKILARAGATWAIGPGEWKSDTAIRSALYENPSHAAYCDEFVKQVSQMIGPRAPHHLSGIRRILLECYGAAAGTLVGAAYADRRLNEQKNVESPNLCLYGTGVPSELFGAMGGSGAVLDGFLNRFLVFFVDDDLPKRHTLGRAEPPADLIENVQQMLRKTDVGDLASMATSSPDARLVPFTDRARVLVDQIGDRQDSEVLRLREADDPMGDMWQRYHQNVVKLALIRVAGDDVDREIDLEDVAWADEIVRWTIERTMIEATARISDSEQEARTKRVLQIIVDAGARGISQSRLTRRTQWLRRSERSDILATLRDGGQVGSREVSREELNAKGPAASVWFATGYSA